jgi:hypothetical protein
VKISPCDYDNYKIWQNLENSSNKNIDDDFNISEKILELEIL